MEIMVNHGVIISYCMRCAKDTEFFLIEKYLHQLTICAISRSTPNLGFGFSMYEK